MKPNWQKNIRHIPRSTAFRILLTKRWRTSFVNTAFTNDPARIANSTISGRRQACTPRGQIIGFGASGSKLDPYSRP